MIPQALQLEVLTILSLGGSLPFARTVVNIVNEWNESDESYVTMVQDHGETSRDSLERGENIRGFPHHTDSQLGCGIRSGLPARFFLIRRTWINGVTRET